MSLLKNVVRITARGQLFAGLCVLALVMLWPPLKALMGMCLQGDRYTYILIVPIVSVAFLYFEREQIFHDSRYCPAVGVPVILLGLAMSCVTRVWPLMSHNMPFAASTMVLICVGSFILCYGVRSFRSAGFPFLFLVLIIPLPGVVFDRVVAALQVGSADVSYLLFRLTGVPILRHGMVMSLPGVDIEVAPQCSGVHSSVALFFVSVVVSRVMLRTSWATAMTILCVGPIAMFRNAVRIVCISLLGVYVDRGFLFGNLHRYGGLPFSLLGFAVLLPLVWLLWKWERRLSIRRMGSEVPALDR